MKNSPDLITTQPELEAFCEAIAGAPYIAVDTEFLRDSTFWPKLCLIQAATPDHAAAIDPLANGIDLAPLLRLMADEQSVKVFHAARQDIEIFVQLMGAPPGPVFDTQIAAMVCGFGDSIGYDKLVSSVAHVQIDKGPRFTNWAERPLSDEQLSYALSDVTYLCVVYERLKSMLEARARTDWVAEEQYILVNPATYDMDPDSAWKRLKTRTEQPRFLNVLRAAAAWREREAIRRDQPRNWVMRDDTLMNVAAQAPKDENTLGRCRGLPKGFMNSRAGADLLAAVSAAADLPASAAPKATPRRQPDPELTATVELLRVILKRAAEEHGVAQRLIASADDLESLAAGRETQILHGWRYKVFGSDAEKLIQGKLGLAVENKRVRIFPLDAA
jgi:ribonuclease D